VDSDDREMRVLRCDCGFEAADDGNEEAVSRARTHALAAHGMDLPAELIKALARPTRSPDIKTDAQARIPGEPTPGM
jgi:predicted small metal-binding protein